MNANGCGSACLLDVSWAGSWLLHRAGSRVSSGAVGVVGRLTVGEFRGDHAGVLLEGRQHGAEDVLVGVQPLAHCRELGRLAAQQLPVRRRQPRVVALPAGHLPAGLNLVLPEGGQDPGQVRWMRQDPTQLH